jgi:hypothetical protein
MGYISPQDAALARERAAQRKMTKATAEHAAELREVGALGQGLFRDPLEATLDESVRVDLNRQQGHVSPNELAVVQEEARAAMRQYWDEWREATGEDMPVTVQNEILAGLQRGQLPDGRVAELKEFVVSHRIKVYETPASMEALLGDARAHTAKEMPLLNALYKATGAGNSVPLARVHVSQAKERARAAKPFGGALRAPSRGLVPTK